MFQLIQDNTVVAETANLTEAASRLLNMNVNLYPCVMVGNVVLLDVAWEYIQGDWYGASGFQAHTDEARLALQGAQALEKVAKTIYDLAYSAYAQVTGLWETFESEARGQLRVHLAWSVLDRFTLDILEADSGVLIYSTFNDKALSGAFGERMVKPTLEYLVAKAAEYGVTLSSRSVELIAARSKIAH